MKLTLMAIMGLGLAGAMGLARSQEKAADRAATNAAPATAAQPAAQPARKAQTPAAFKVIGYLEKRDRVITIKSGPEGVVYSVATKEGKVLFEDLSAKQLQAKAPELHDLIKSGVAGAGALRTADLRPRFDASMR